jgi:hypothetical protein
MNKANPCQLLREQFSQLSSGRHLADLLDDFFYSCSSKQEKAVTNLLQERKEFFAVYQKYVSQLLVDWYGSDEIKDQIDFESSGRVVIKGSLFDGFDFASGKKTINHFPSIIRKVEGDLMLVKAEISSLDYLEEVGTLNLALSTVESARRLKRVNHRLRLTECKIRNLSSLEFVGGNLVARSVRELEQMENLRFVGGNLNIQDSSIKKLPELIRVNGIFYAVSAKDFSAAPKLKIVGSDFYLPPWISDLSSLETVKGDFLAEHVGGLQTAPKLKVVGGDFNVSNSLIISFPELTEIKGDAQLKDAQLLESLAELREVGGSVFLNGSSHIESMPKLVKVHGVFDARGAVNLRDLSQLVEVERGMYLINTGINNLSKLERVGNYLYLENCVKLEVLPNLIEVDGVLCLTGSNVKRLPDLIKSGRLRITNVAFSSFQKAFPKLETVTSGTRDFAVFVSEDHFIEEVKELVAQGKLDVQGAVKKQQTKYKRKLS